MPRPRKSNPLNLPPRVYHSHGAFYFHHRDGRWEPLGTDVAEARERGRRIHSGDGAGTMRGYIADYLTWCAARVKSGKLAPRTLEDYRRDLVPIEQYCGHMLPTDITPHHVQSYLDLGVQMDRGTHANREKAALSACLTWIRTRCPDAGLIANPCLGVRRNPETPRDVYVETAELNAVRALATPMLRAYADLVLLTLQRPSDVLAWTRANLRTRAVDGIEKKVIATRQNKTGRTLEIEIDARIAAALATLKIDAIGVPLIHGRGRRGYTETGIASMWRRLCKRAGVATFGVMDLRGKGATDMYQAGVPLEQIQALMGHESVTTTEIYVKRRLKFVAAPNQATGTK